MSVLLRPFHRWWWIIGKSVISHRFREQELHCVEALGSMNHHKHTPNSLCDFIWGRGGGFLLSHSGIDQCNRIGAGWTGTSPGLLIEPDGRRRLRVWQTHKRLFSGYIPVTLVAIARSDWTRVGLDQVWLDYNEYFIGWSAVKCLWPQLFYD